MRIRSCLLCLPLSAAVATATPAFDGVDFSHHDWELACDNTGTCRAAGYSEEGSERPLSLLLTRAAGPAAPVQAELQLGDYDGDRFDAGAMPRLTMWIDGAPRGELQLRELRATLDPAQTAAVLQVLRGSGRIEWSDPQQRHWELSTRGSTAVLLKMDDVQGRIDTPGALVRPGGRDEALVPAARPAPVLHVPALLPTRGDEAARLASDDSLRPALLGALVDDDACPELEMNPDAPRQYEAWRLDAGHLLVAHPCWSAAYNTGTGFWVVRDEAPWQPRLVTTAGTGFDGRGTITAAHKGRGLGDCWSSQSWSWDGQRFVQTSRASTGMCRLIAAGGAWDLPVRVTEVRPASAETAADVDAGADRDMRRPSFALSRNDE